MLRARLSNGDFLFGLDAENLRRLRAGQPIVIDLSTMGGTGRIMLMFGFGEMLADILKELESVTGPLPPAQPYRPAPNETDD